VEIYDQILYNTRCGAKVVAGAPSLITQCKLLHLIFPHQTESYNFRQSKVNALNNNSAPSLPVCVHASPFHHRWGGRERDGRRKEFIKYLHAVHLSYATTKESKKGWRMDAATPPLASGVSSRKI